VLRRVSGGGAVYVYPGNLNVSVACSDARPLGTVSEAFAWLAAAVAAAARRLGVRADPAARSVVVRTGKIAGLAQARRASAVLVHSTLLVDSDDLDMASFLRAMRGGYAPRGTSSTPSPVTTLSEALGRPVRMEEVVAALRWALEPEERAEPAAWGELTAEEADAARRLAGTRYRSRAWNERAGKTS
jgi:lipoate-protein ligase A